MLDFHRFDFRKVMMGRAMIEKLREGKAQLHQTYPVQVTQDDALSGFLLGCLNQLHLLVEITPVLAVVDHPIDPGPELRVHWGAELLLPPKIEREVRIELGENNVRQQAALFALDRKRKLLGTDLLAARATTWQCALIQASTWLSFAFGSAAITIARQAWSSVI
jgi:hypothetical protein